MCEVKSGGTRRPPIGGGPQVAVSRESFTVCCRLETELRLYAEADLLVLSGTGIGIRRWRVEESLA